MAKAFAVIVGQSQTHERELKSGGLPREILDELLKEWQYTNWWHHANRVNHVRTSFLVCPEHFSVTRAHEVGFYMGERKVHEQLTHRF